MTVQRSYFTVLFFVKKSKPLKNGEVPICMRITVNGKRAEVQIRRTLRNCRRRRASAQAAAFPTKDCHN